MTEALKGSNSDPVVYLLGQEYVKGLTKLGDSQNGKVVVLPADLIESVKSIFKK